MADPPIESPTMRKEKKAKINHTYTRSLCSAAFSPPLNIPSKSTPEFNLSLYSGGSSTNVISNEQRVLELNQEEEYVLNNWLNLSSRWHLIRPKVQLKAISNGIPETLRYLVWRNILDPKYFINHFSRSSLQDILNLSTENPSWHHISLDISRTLPKFPVFATTEGQVKLETVLKAYSNLDPEVGYFQGFSFIAGVLLYNLNLDPEITIWCFNALLNEPFYNLKSLFINSFAGLEDLTKIWVYFFKKKFPQIAQRIDKLGISHQLYASSWFLTIFASIQFSPDFITFVFDRFIAFGPVALISFGLTLIAMHRKKLLSSAFPDVLNILQHPNETGKMNNIAEVAKKWDLQWIDKKSFDKASAKIHSPV